MEVYAGCKSYLLKSRATIKLILAVIKDVRKCTLHKCGLYIPCTGKT